VVEGLGRRLAGQSLHILDHDGCVVDVVIDDVIERVYRWTTGETGVFWMEKQGYVLEKRNEGSESCYQQAVDE